MVRVLIVDDEAAIRDTFSRILERDGHDVVTAEDAVEAMGRLEEKPYDVMFTDIVMPRINGVSLMKAARSEIPKIKVVLMTGAPTIETATEAVRAGAFDYLKKPVGKESLCRVVRNAEKILDSENQNERYKENLEELVSVRTAQLQAYGDKLKHIARTTVAHAAICDEDELAEKTLLLLQDVTGVQGGSYYRVLEDKLELMYAIDGSHQPEILPLPLDDCSILGRVMEFGAALFVANVDEREDLNSSGWDGYRDGAAVIVPIREDGRFRALISLHNKQAGVLDEQDLDLAILVSGNTLSVLKVLEASQNWKLD